MDYKKGIYYLLDHYGRDVTVKKGGKYYSDKAIVQLMRYKNKMYLDLPHGEAGSIDNGSYLYIGKPDYDFSRDWHSVRITSGGYTYLVKRAQMIYCGNEPLYVWAVLYPAVKDGDYEEF